MVFDIRIIKDKNCVICLNDKRKLYPIQPCHLLLLRCLPKLQFDSKEIKICWECKAILVKISNFYVKAMRTQKMLTFMIGDDKASNTISQQSSLASTPVTVTCICENYCTPNVFNDPAGRTTKKCALKNKKDNVMPSAVKKELPNGNSVDCDKQIHTEFLDCPLRESTDSKLEEINGICERDKSLDSDPEATDSAEEIGDNGYVHGYYYVDKDDLTDLYSIERMTDEQLSKYRQKKKKSRKFSNSKSKCDHCIESFDRHTFKHHMQKHARAYGPLICSVCKLGFLRHRELNRHLAGHHILYKCTKCNFSSTLWEVFEHHIRRVHSPKTCTVCNQDFPSKKDYNLHKVMHQKQEELTCAVCSKVMKSKSYLLTHMRLAHEVTPLLECDICHKKYLGKVNLRNHLRIHENKLDEAAYCVECGIQYKCVYSYQKHLRESSKHNTHRESKFNCIECDKKFMCGKSYEYHMKSQHLKRKDHWCETCSLGFYTKWKLRAHVYKVHEERKNGNVHRCNICNNIFKEKAILREHMNTHTGARPYMCPVCGATFGFKAALYTHNKLIHLKLKRGKHKDTEKLQNRRAISANQLLDAAS